MGEASPRLDVIVLHNCHSQQFRKEITRMKKDKKINENKW